MEFFDALKARHSVRVNPASGERPRNSNYNGPNQFEHPSLFGIWNHEPVVPIPDATPPSST